MARRRRRFKHLPSVVSSNQTIKPSSCACASPATCVCHGQNLHHQPPVHAPAVAPWPDLPADALRDISGRLRNATDFVRFHAVCKAWRDTSSDAIRTPPPPPKQPSFLPWLHAPNIKDLKFRCIFSRKSYRAAPPSRHRNLVASADGAALWYLVDGPCPTLRDILTGAVVAHLPPFPEGTIKRWLSKGTAPSGRLGYGVSSIVYGDGTTLLYGLYETDPQDDSIASFWAALLHPGEAAWTVVERTLQCPHTITFYAAYHRGKILVTVGANTWHAVTPDDHHGVGDVTVPRPWMPGERRYVRNYLLESHGELLWASVQVRKGCMDRGRGDDAFVSGLVGALSVSIHVLEGEATKKMQWVRKDGKSLANLVLFLGWPNSYAVDASRLSGDAVLGGCAYFMLDAKDGMSRQSCYVFRHNLVNDKAKFMEQLPRGWNDDMCMWLFPQPGVAPNQEISERSKSWWKRKNRRTSPTPKSTIRIERPQQQQYKSHATLIVRNLPRGVTNFQLRRFFGQYGQVSKAKVRCKKKTNISRGFGHVTVKMVEEDANALAILDGLVLGGCILEVSIVKVMSRPRQHVKFAGSGEYSEDYDIYFGFAVLLLFALVVLWMITQLCKVVFLYLRNRLISPF
uniref:RRM domain-containing protein n=1 Tax=Hordeum vulgare subsp. vulgare TaxID=112509 RepID=A0A8I6WEU5_HORVV